MGMSRADRAVELFAKYNLDTTAAQADLKALAMQMARLRELEDISNATPGRFGPGGKRYTKDDIAKAKEELKKLGAEAGNVEARIAQLGKEFDALYDTIKRQQTEVRRNNKRIDDEQDDHHKRQQGRIREEERTREVAERARRQTVKTGEAEDKRAHTQRIQFIHQQAEAQKQVTATIVQTHTVTAAAAKATQAQAKATVDLVKAQTAQVTANDAIAISANRAASAEHNAAAAAARRAIAEERLRRIQTGPNPIGGGRPSAFQRGPNRFGGIAGTVQLPGGGLTTGALGMLGANLYGAGMVGLAGVGARSAMEAYAESYNLKVMLAGVIQTFGEFRDKTGNIIEGMEKYEKSRAFSEELYAKLRRKAVDSPVTFQDLSQGYLVAAPYLAKSGLSFDQSLEVSNLLVTLGKMQNLPLKSIVDDIRALSTGRLTNAQTLQSMGFSKDDMKQLQQLRGDDLFNFIMEKGEGFRQAIKEFEGSFTVAWDRMLDAFYTMRIKFGEKLAGPLSDFAKNVTKTLNQWEVDGTLDRFTENAKNIMESVGGLMKFLIENFDKIVGSVELYLGVKLADAFARMIAGIWVSAQTQIAAQQAGTAVGAAGGLAAATARGGLLGGVINVATKHPVGAAAVTGAMLLMGGMWLDARNAGIEAGRLDANAEANKFIYNPGPEANAAVAEHLREYLRSGKMPAVPSGAELADIDSKEGLGKIVGNYKIGAGKARNIIEQSLRQRAGKSPVPITRQSIPYHPNYKSSADVRKYIERHASDVFLTNEASLMFSEYQGGVKFRNLSATQQEAFIKHVMRVGDIRKVFSGFTLPTTLGPGKQYSYGDSIGPKDSSSMRAFLEGRIKELDPTPVTNGEPYKPETKQDKGGGGSSSVTPTILEADITAQVARLGSLERDNESIERQLARTSPADYAKRSALIAQRRKNDEAIARTQHEIAMLQATKQVQMVESTGKGGVPASQARATALRSQIEAQFGKRKIEQFANRKVRLKGGSGDKPSAHATGSALDVYGTKDEMYRMSRWATEQGVDTVIYGGQYWTAASQKWRSTDGTKMLPHHDHVHMEYTPSVSGKGAVTLRNKTVKDANKIAEAQAELDSALQAAAYRVEQELAQAYAEYAAYIEKARQGRLDMRQAVLKYVRAGDFASKDPNRVYSANVASLQIEAERVMGGQVGTGIGGVFSRLSSLFTPTGLGLLGRFNELGTERNQALQQMREQEYTKRIQQSLSASVSAFRERAGAIGLEGSDLAQYQLNTKIQKYEQMLGSDNPAMVATAQLALKSLYELRSAIDKNTNALARQTQVQLTKMSESVFNTGERLSPTAQYRKQFDDAMLSVDNMSDSEVRAAMSTTLFAGQGLANLPVDIQRNMLKINRGRGFTNAGFKGAMFRERGMGMVNAVFGAMASGQDPLQALLSVKGKGPGDDALGRLVESMFSGGVYTKEATLWGVPLKKRIFDKGAFSKDLISGGGSFLANLMVQQGMFGKNNFSNEGSQVGGMLASMGAFSSLGAWAGPVGILGGALIGSLFGKRRPEDPAIAQHRKNLEDLLKTISNRLKPQEDYYRTIRGDAVFGSASRLYGGRQSSLGARVALGVM